MIRVLFWSTTWQADNHALAHALAGEEDFEVTVAMAQPERWRAEPVGALLPFAGQLVDREDPGIEARLAREQFDLLVVDNHLPRRALAPRVLVLWHGFGWRVDDLSTTRRELGKLAGDVTRPSEALRWASFGDWDSAYRQQHSGIAAENLFTLGSPYSDWLLPDSPGRVVPRAEQVCHAYTIDIERPVVQLGLTWHHGGSLGHWGDEAQLLESLVQHVAQAGASTLLRAHDRHRYAPDYVAMLEELAARHPGRLQLKFKSESPDSLVDLLVSDVLVSNYSSLLNAWYYTGKPSLHVDPHDASAAQQVSYKMRFGLPMPERVSAEEKWKLPPSEHGGLRATSFEELLAGLDRALREPRCCEEQAARFVQRYIHRADGGTCQRAAEMLRHWV